MSNAYRLVEMTGLFFKDLKKWKVKDKDQCTWTEFKLFMMEAQEELQ